MADGTGRPKPHWRGLMGAMFGLGRETLAERAAMLERAFAEEGITAMLPGDQPVNWRCDPIPLPLSSGEFAALESGLGQRARLLEAILADLYGPQDLLAEGLLPTDLVFDNPNFLRACRSSEFTRRDRYLHFYAADLLRGPDGAWRVLADHTSQGSGIGYALENRRILARVVPELFQSPRIVPLRPFLDICADSLQALLPSDHSSVALLSRGHHDPLWFEHVLLSREFSIELVEGADLTIRGGAVFLKTLRGLQRIGVLLRRTPGDLIDPLELGPGAGTPGLMEAARAGNVRIVNDAGSAVVEAPGLAAFLPALARRLLDEDLVTASQATLWLGEGAVVRTVLRDLEGWIIRPATDGNAAPVRPTLLSTEERATLAARIGATPNRFAAAVAPTPSVAPTIGPNGLDARPIALRMFLAFDGSRWHAMPGGLARALSEEDALAARLPRNAVSKDVWVIADETAAVQGGLGLTTPTLAIRRTSGDLPSRVADNFYWLGRHLERLEEAARLQRALLTRILRPSPSPREVFEMQLLVRCLNAAGMLPGEDATVSSGTMLASAALRSFRSQGGLRLQLGRVNGQVGQLRDRLTEELYAVLTRSMRDLGDAMRQLPPDSHPRVLEQGTHLTVRILEFAAAVAGLAAENMVRGGGRLFMDFGRRIERAQAIVSQLAQVLEPDPSAQPGKVEAALRLALELRDSVITYRSRYLSILQP
ncbi:MAG: circularly permuted type 2 ATP-grasp protein, partial [Acetobacteraceae bacterium]